MYDIFDAIWGGLIILCRVFRNKYYYMLYVILYDGLKIELDDLKNIFQI